MPEIYQTRDLVLATTLLTLKFQLLGIDIQIEGSHPNAIGYFKFEESPDLLVAEQRYMNRELAVEPITFSMNMKSLKARVLNATKKPNM